MVEAPNLPLLGFCLLLQPFNIADRSHATPRCHAFLCASQALLWLGSLTLSGALPANPGEIFDPTPTAAEGGRQLQFTTNVNLQHVASNLVNLKILVGEASDPNSYIAYNARGAWH